MQWSYAIGALHGNVKTLEPLYGWPDYLINLFDIFFFSLKIIQFFLDFYSGMIIHHTKKFGDWLHLAIILSVRTP